MFMPIESRRELLTDVIRRNSFAIKMQQGTIVSKRDRGFGFIKIEGQEKDLFFHSKELNGVTFDELQEGDVVTFEVADSPKGPNAVNVSRA